MESALLLAATAAVAFGLFLLFRNSRWNNQPRQKALAHILLQAAVFEVSKGSHGTLLNLHELFRLQRTSGWSDRETRERLVHALSMIRTVVDADTYYVAKRL